MKKVGVGFFQSVAIRLPCAFIVASFLFWANDGRAQSFQVSSVQPISEVQPAESDSVVAVAADTYGLSQTSLESLPVMGGTFWIVESNGVIPPFPFLPVQYWNCHAWEMADGIYLVDATGGQVPILPLRLAREAMTANAVQSAQLAVEAQGNAVANLIGQVQDAEFMQAAAAMFGFDMRMLDSGSESSANFAYSFDTNALWLEITNFSNGFSCYNLHNATNLVYAIWTTTNLLMPFAVETELWPTDPNCQPFTLQNNSRQYLFVRAEDWTGVDSDSDGVPDWWAWKYFGTTDAAMTNLDLSNGNTFAQDYSNNVTPTVFKFTGLEVPNNYVSTTTAAVQLDVAGNPYYVATLIDDSNFSNAVWNTYSGSTVTVNLGSSQGWHDVWIGLRGHADDGAYAVWQWKRLKLDYTAPTLFITNPTNSMVNIPMIQLQGFSPEALGSISYDLTNAAGWQTKQQVLVLNQTYDTNTWEFTTNTFQAFDVALTNGANTFIFHATDLAGNATTASYSVSLDYSSKTNPPNVQVTWPQTGMKIANNTVTIRGQVADATVMVSTSIINTNGVTNLITGVVERSGRFWLDNLPLQSGTNTLAVTVADVVGNVTTTNLVLVQDAMTLTMNSVTDTSELWQPFISVNGAVSDLAATIYVNGIQGTNYGDGTWSADNVPVTDGGVAIFDLKAVPAGGGDPDNSVNQDKPWRVYLAHDMQNQTGSTHDNSAGVENDGGDNTADGDENSDSKNFYHYDHDWDSVNGGSGSQYNRSFWVDGNGNSSSNLTSGTMMWTPPNGVETDTADDGTVTTNAISLPIFGNEHCKVNDPKNPTPTVYGLDGWDDDIITNTYGENYTRKADTIWHVQTGGRAVPGLLNLCQFSGGAWEVLNKRSTPSLLHDQVIDPTKIKILGNNLNTNGTCYKLLPNDTEFDVTPKVSGKDFYTFSVSGQKYLSYFDVYVLEGNPGGFSPIGEYDEGHAWWGLRTEAPQDALKYLSPTNQWFLAQGKYGYYPTTYTLPGCLWCPGQLQVPESHGEFTVKMSFYIGFNNLINAIEFTRGLRASPGTYVAPGHNCIQAVRDAAVSAGAGCAQMSIWPQYFGMMINLMYPDEDTVYYKFFLP